MIVGGGDIASVLNDRSDCMFFASGVSNSQCVDPAEFEREKNKLHCYMLVNLVTNKSIVYFSTISINLINTPYTKHKKEMEEMIRKGATNYNIIRLGNIDWGKNPHTFINYIKAKKAKGEPVEIRNEFKYMISKEQLLYVTDNLPATGKHDISVFGDIKRVKDCL